MTEQPPLIPLPSPGWTFLARGKRKSDILSICPEGHIHLEYGNLTFRFERDEFLAVAQMFAEAAARLQGSSPNSMHLHIPRSSVSFSLN